MIFKFIYLLNLIKFEHVLIYISNKLNLKCTYINNIYGYLTRPNKIIKSSPIFTTNYITKL